MSIILTADSSCDLPPEQMAPVPFEIIPLSIIQQGTSYYDGVEISREALFRGVSEHNAMPSTSAVNIVDYEAVFQRLSETYEAVIHLNISAELSACHQHALIAAEQFSNVYVIDTRNISTGQGLVLLEARKKIMEQASLEEILSHIAKVIPRVSFTFLLDQLTYLAKGGRCSTLTALGANLLRLKPMLAVKNGEIVLANRYRGNLDKVIPIYIKEQLKTMPKGSRAMLVSSSCPEHWTDAAFAAMEEQGADFVPTLYQTGCTISTHSGPNAIGIAVISEAAIE